MNRIILFGAASSGKQALLNLTQQGNDLHNISFYDNNPEKWGKEIMGVKVLSFQGFISLSKNTKIYITSFVHKEIESQLKELKFTNYIFDPKLLHMQQFFLKYDTKFINLINNIGNNCYLDNDEKYTLYSSMLATRNLEGEIAEIGVYKGGSAKILCEFKEDKEIHLFDTFEGLPQEVITKDDLVKEGWCGDTTLEKVESYLKNYTNVYFYKGVFPCVHPPDRNFCLVHIDTDIYQGTYDSLVFFYPRMVRNGRIIIHDYNNVDCPGVKKAVKKYFKLEEIIELASKQCMITK